MAEEFVPLNAVIWLSDERVYLAGAQVSYVLAGSDRDCPNVLAKWQQLGGHVEWMRVR